MEAVPARADFQIARLGDFAFQSLSAKGRYMARDIARIAEGRGLPFKMAAAFPGNGLKAARLGTLREAKVSSGIQPCVFSAAFGQGLDVFDDAVLTDCLSAAGLDADIIRSLAKDGAVKSELRAIPNRRRRSVYSERRASPPTMASCSGRRPSRSGSELARAGGGPPMATVMHLRRYFIGDFRGLGE